MLLDLSGDQPTLFYVFPDPADPAGAYKLVVPIDYRIKVRDAGGNHSHEVANVVRSGRRVPLQNLRGGGYDLLDGQL